MLLSFAFVLLVSAFLWRKGSEFEKWGRSRNAKMGGKDDVAIWRRGDCGGGGRSTDELHPEPSGHFKLYSATLRVEHRA